MSSAGKIELTDIERRARARCAAAQIEGCELREPTDLGQPNSCRSYSRTVVSVRPYGQPCPFILYVFMLENVDSAQFQGSKAGDNE